MCGVDTQTDRKARSKLSPNFDLIFETHRARKGVSTTLAVSGTKGKRDKFAGYDFGLGSLHPFGYALDQGAQPNDHQ